MMSSAGATSALRTPPTATTWTSPRVSWRDTTPLRRRGPAAGSPHPPPMMRRLLPAKCQTTNRRRAAVAARVLAGAVARAHGHGTDLAVGGLNWVSTWVYTQHRAAAQAEMAGCWSAESSAEGRWSCRLSAQLSGRLLVQVGCIKDTLSLKQGGNTQLYPKLYAVDECLPHAFRGDRAVADCCCRNFRLNIRIAGARIIVGAYPWPPWPRRRPRRIRRRPASSRTLSARCHGHGHRSSPPDSNPKNSPRCNPK